MATKSRAVPNPNVLYILLKVISSVICVNNYALFGWLTCLRTNYDALQVHNVHIFCYRYFTA